MKPTTTRARDVSLHVMVSQSEYNKIRERMAEVGSLNMSAFVRKMALNGYILHVDLTPVKELVSLQRRCANNINQAAINVNTRGHLSQEEITNLRNDYDTLWKPLSELIKQLAEIVKL